ncbi:MAG: carotenoid biosynthesis protein [Prolixibacteraceae bacterium]
MATKKVKYSVYFLILFYFVGIAGFILPATRALFSILTPFALLLSAGFLAAFHRPRFTLHLLIVFVLIFLLSFFAEMIGVKTGLLFGHYNYGSGLGPKIWETPIIIGLNWLMLVYCTRIIAGYVFNPAALKILFASLLMVAYDVILEKAAPLLNMWSWEGSVVPLQNYIAWFVLALLFHILLNRAGVRISNKLALPVFVIQALFFVILIFFYRTFAS